MAKAKRTSNIIRRCSHGEWTGFAWGGHRRMFKCEAIPAPLPEMAYEGYAGIVDSAVKKMQSLLADLTAAERAQASATKLVSEIRKKLDSLKSISE